ncbi:MAG: phosphatidylglycerophosphatase A [Deltaproteobacteria bacterium]|nr:phosphatidylglycerophosphatase A [Deltaproteobacteria bacterium]
MKKFMLTETRENLVLFIASGAYVGAVPVAPGTFGTLMALPLWWFFNQLPAGLYLVFLLLLIMVAFWSAGEAERILHQVDSGVIVIDEIVGFLLTTVLISFSWPRFIAAFLLFRFFDILKPFPVNWCDENLHGGIGVVVDDLVAGIMAYIVLRLLLVIGL